MQALNKLRDKIKELSDEKDLSIELKTLGSGKNLTIWWKMHLIRIGLIFMDILSPRTIYQVLKILIFFSDSLSFNKCLIGET